jgi:phosphohistidine phosphatase
MNILVIRHAIAADRERSADKHGGQGDDDGARPLTHRGRTRMRAAVRGLRRVVPRIDLLATSPLTRAAQTADIVMAAYRGAKRVELPQLAPDKPVTSLLRWVQEQHGKQPARRDFTVALIGHEPQLGVFASWMLTGLQESFVPLKKGGACLLHCKADVKPGRAVLLWLLKPSHLRDLGE